MNRFRSEIIIYNAITVFWIIIIFGSVFLFVDIGSSWHEDFISKFLIGLLIMCLPMAVNKKRLRKAIYQYNEVYRNAHSQETITEDKRSQYKIDNQIYNLLPASCFKRNVIYQFGDIGLSHGSLDDIGIRYFLSDVYYYMFRNKHEKDRKHIFYGICESALTIRSEHDMFGPNYVIVVSSAMGKPTSGTVAFTMPCSHKLYVGESKANYYTLNYHNSSKGDGTVDVIESLINRHPSFFQAKGNEVFLFQGNQVTICSPKIYQMSKSKKKKLRISWFMTEKRTYEIASQVQGYHLAQQTAIYDIARVVNLTYYEEYCNKAQSDRKK